MDAIWNITSSCSTFERHFSSPVSTADSTTLISAGVNSSLLSLLSGLSVFATILLKANLCPNGFPLCFDGKPGKIIGLSRVGFCELELVPRFQDGSFGKLTMLSMGAGVGFDFDLLFFVDNLFLISKKSLLLGQL